jgi:hypothetical protein
VESGERQRTFRRNMLPLSSENEFDMFVRSVKSSKVKVTLRTTVSRPVILGVKPLLGPKTRFALLLDNCGFVGVGRPL